MNRSQKVINHSTDKTHEIYRFSLELWIVCAFIIHLHKPVAQQVTTHSIAQSSTPHVNFFDLNEKIGLTFDTNFFILKGIKLFTHHTKKSNERATTIHNFYLVILNAGYPSKGLEYTDEEDTFIHRFADYRLET